MAVAVLEVNLNTASMQILNEQVRFSFHNHTTPSISVLTKATEERAENARPSFVGALALGDLVKSTLGPKGMNKIFQSGSSGDINVTNDGATILNAIQLNNAATKILVDIPKVQDDEVGDGTTSVCVLAAECLREAERLISQKIHPQTLFCEFGGGCSAEAQSPCIVPIFVFFPDDCDDNEHRYLRNSSISRSSKSRRQVDGFVSG